MYNKNKSNNKYRKGTGPSRFFIVIHIMSYNVLTTSSNLIINFNFIPIIEHKLI